MVIICILLSALATYIAISIFTINIAGDGGLKDIIIAATVVLSASMWGCAAWIVAHFKKSGGDIHGNFK